MSILNKQAYVVEKDKLVYDSKHPIDVANIPVTITPSDAGEIKRGQILDCKDGEYSLHAEDGEPSAIVAETTSYAADDTTVVVTAYISGSFRASEIVANPELTAADTEALRGKGIYLK